MHKNKLKSEKNKESNKSIAISKSINKFKENDKNQKHLIENSKKVTGNLISNENIDTSDIK